MNATTVAVDLAKNVFELAVADAHWKIMERTRLTRAQFERWFDNRSVRLVVMEACGSAHHWARTIRARGIEVRLLPAQYVRAYVKRNKTDRADAQALLEAARAGDIRPVAVKSIEQQGLQALHRTRSGWMSTRTRRINTLRGFCREFGSVVPEGATTGLACMAHYLADDRSGLPELLGNTRYLGRISKRGDRYIRMLLTHAARSVLRAATVAHRAGRPIDRLKSWALAVQGRSNHNKAALSGSHEPSVLWSAIEPIVPVVDEPER
jgi:transposase